MSEPLTREQIEGYISFGRDIGDWETREDDLARAALHYEARLREVEAERDELLLWRDKRAQFVQDMRERAEKAESERDESYRQHTGAGKQHVTTQKRLRELAVHSKVGWDKAKFWHEEAIRLGSTSVPDETA